jgi:hypothetical protein
MHDVVNQQQVTAVAPHWRDVVREKFVATGPQAELRHGVSEQSLHENQTREPCPGSGQPPHEIVSPTRAMRLGKKMIYSYGTCFWCRKVLYINSSDVLHVHQGLPALGERCT